MTAEELLFYALAVLAVFSATLMVTLVRSVVASVLCLGVTLVSLAGISVLLHAELVAAIQLLVHAGALLVLFLFVLMLVDLRDGGRAAGSGARNAVKAVGIAGTLAIATLLVATMSAGASREPLLEGVPQGFGGHQSVGASLFTEHVIALELAGVILLAGAVGAMALARRGSE